MHYTILGGNHAFIMCDSVTCQAYPPIFDSYNECKHFIGYLKTNTYNNYIYNEWYVKYYDSNENFIGKLSEWDYSTISLYEEPNKFNKIINACDRLYQKFKTRSFKDNCRRIGCYIETKINNEWYDW